jgi:hypothetical protein
VLLTRSPLVYPRKGLTVRLACVKHAASVRPEPESNSPNKNQTVRNNPIQTTSQNWQKTTTPPKRENKRRGKNKNNKQKPPNTLLSSQTTHPFRPCNQPAARAAR